VDGRFRNAAGRFVRAPRRFKDLTGRTFGRLKAVRFAGYKQATGGTNVVWKCRCNCGRLVFPIARNLIIGSAQSCGCRKLDIVIARNKRRMTHGHTANQKVAQGTTPEYRSWQAMKGRVLNPNNSSYSDYGGKGVRVCKRWLGKNGFVNFLHDLGERKPGTTLGRFKDNGNYRPGNVKYMSRAEQQVERLKKRQGGA
jgi:hypothetical protein